MSTNENLKQQIIQKAWEDPTFKENLLADPKSTIQKTFGIEIPKSLELIAVEENTNLYYLVIPPKPSEVIVEGVEPEARW